MDGELTLDTLQQLLQPFGYQQDQTQEKSLFWKRVQQRDLRSPYAFSLVLITLDALTIYVEGINEPRIKRAINAGLIEINAPEDLEALKEIVFEATLDQTERLETVLKFLDQQLTTIEQEPVDTPAYETALSNIELLVEAANEVEY